MEELNEPSGWVTILPPRPEGEGGTENVLRTHFIQVAILANHQNGRDTHIRQIKICTVFPVPGPFFLRFAHIIS